MSSIDPSGRLLAILRQQARELRRQQPAGSDAATTASSQHQERAPQQPALGLAAIDPAAPDARRQAFRIFLQSVLARELGTGMAETPEFPALVKRVQDTMEADAELKEAIEQAGELLLKSARPLG